jgi:hypothetical protein
VAGRADRLDRLHLLRDVLARCTRAQEALQDGDPGYAEQVIDDMAADLWQQVEQVEREASQ